MNDLSKAVAVCALFFFFTATVSLGLQIQQNHVGRFTFQTDSVNHFEGKKYAPLYGWIDAPFRTSQWTFYLFNLFLLSFVFPLALFWISKEWLSVFFYFFATNVFWFTDAYGTVPALLVVLFAILLFKSKDFLSAAILLAACYLTHASGFLFGLGAMLAVGFSRLFEQEWLQWLGLLVLFMIGGFYVGFQQAFRIWLFIPIPVVMLLLPYWKKLDLTHKQVSLFVVGLYFLLNIMQWYSVKR